MVKLLILFLLATSSHIYSTPIISIKENKLKSISYFTPYIYGKRNRKIFILGQKEILSYLKKNNIKYNIIYKDENSYLLEKKSIISNEQFIKYHEIEEKINELAERYPDIVKKIIIGKSSEGRDINGIKTILNPYAPKYRIVGGIHGDEAMAYQFVYDFMVELIENNKKYRDILNNTQIYIIPMLNPDGAVNITRRNSNNTDLNRNMGFFWKTVMFSGENIFSEPETRALRDFTLNENFTMSFSFHTFGDIINYVWNFSPDKVPDTNEIVNLSNLYKSFTNYKITEGYDWYQTTGDLNDYSYGTAGTLDWTIEIDDSDKDGNIFRNNRNALISILKTSKYGIEGVIHDENDLPVKATVIIDGRSVFYNNGNGYFYRYLLNGYHHIKILAQNHETYENFIKINFDKAFLDIKLNKKITRTYFTEKIISLKADLGKYNYTNVSMPQNILFLPDNKFFSLPFNAELMIEVPDTDKEKYIDIITKNNFDTNLTVEGYKTLDENYLFSLKYSENSILITRNIKYIKIIENNSENGTLIDAVLFRGKKTDENKTENDKKIYYKGSAVLCSFSSDNDLSLLILIFTILNVYIIRRRKYIEKK